MRNEVRARVELIALCLILALLVPLIFVAIDVSRQNSATAGAHNNGLPIMRVSLNNVSLIQVDESSKDIKYRQNTLTIEEDGRLQSFSGVELKGHGNSTRLPAKKSYQIKLAHKTNLFGLGSAKKWLLLANSLDDSLLRNDLAFHLEHLLGMDYALSGQFAELFVDSTYLGLYYITPKVEIGKQRINLTHPNGILVEIDNLHQDDDSEICYFSVTSQCLKIKDVVDKTSAESSMANFLIKFNQLELAVSSGDYSLASELAELDGFAKYYLLSELSANPDAYASSLYFYQNGPEDQLHIGLGWDYDLAFSNSTWNKMPWYDHEYLYLPYVKMAQTDSVLGTLDGGESLSFFTLFYDLLQMPEFEERVKIIYQQTLAGQKDAVTDYFKDTYDKIRSAATQDSGKWGYDFEKAVEAFSDWFSRRYTYLDSIYLAS